MNDVEKWLRADRAAGVPEPPDVRYTAAAVRRRLAVTQPVASRSTDDGLIVAAGVAAAITVILTAFWLGLSLWVLLLFPLAALPLLPILLAKGVDPR